MRTAFEVVAGNLGAQNAVGGGGRYDGLVEALGGPPLAGIGFALGVERLLMAADGEGAGAARRRSTSSRSPAAPPRRRVDWCGGCARIGMRCELEAAGRSIKSAMRRADKLAARFAILVGEDELRAGRATVRDLRRQADHRLALAVDDSGPALAATLRTLATAGGQGG